MAKREEWERAASLMHKLPQATSGQVVELLAYAQRLHHYAETACNYGLTPAQEKRVTNLETKVKAICADLDLAISVKFNGDPRGYAVKLMLPSGDFNTWGGKEEGWGI